jgi:biopolymer transport protein ExbB/TolQ
MADLFPLNTNFTDFLSVFPVEISDSLSFLIQMVKIVLVIMLLYIIILIISKILGFSRERKLYKNFKIIAENTEQINQKLDTVIRNLSMKPEREEKIEEIEEVKPKKKKK